MHDAVIVNRGFQALNTVHFNHNIKCVAQRAAEAVAVHYAIGSSHVTSVSPFLPHEAHSKHTVGGDISQLIYIKKYRLYVAFCLDLTLRVFSEHFDPLQTVHVTATVLSFAFNENTSELYCGGIGRLEVWQLQHQLHSPLIPGKVFSCSVGQQQWVVSLYCDVFAEKLVLTCQDLIYIIDTQSRKQTDVFSNLHKSSITSAVLYPQMDYLISAAKDGSIKVWNCILHTEVHTFAGHLKAVTGLKPHPLSPCVISCSLDGTVRIWSLENMTESYRLDCGEELLGLSCDFPKGVRMACFSHQNVKMWAVNKVESHFATVNSHVARMVRVEGAGGDHPARILALAEDGGVRLLSPVTGQVVSILFPMFSSQIVHEVAYSLSENLLFSFLRTGEVLVFSSLTNPCCASQLWTSASERNRITCISLCTVVDEKSGLQSLLFGGQKCGHISLLHASGLSMPHPCPAHAGHVIKLTGPAGHIDLASPDPALVSCGSDNMLSIWSLEANKRTQKIALKIRMSINLELCPTYMGLLHSTLCLALSDNKIVQLNISPDSRHESLAFHSLPLLTHQSEDDHIEEITSLSACTHLKLFASSSSDGYVKVWSTDNHLVSEIHFGASLASVGFANPRGDLLVGFQKHICIVEAGNYLPAELVMEYPRCGHDCVERPKPFDPELEFWYDPARVPSLPVQQEKRKLLPTPNRGPNCGVLLEEEEDPVGSGATSVDSAASKRSLQFCYTQMVDRPLARKLSLQYFASLDPEHRIRSSMLKSPSRQEALNVTEDYFDQCGSSSQQLQNSLDSSKHGTLASIAELPGESQGGISSSNSIVLDSQNKTPPAAEILPLESASSKFPIAPDCLVPNSIIRAKIGYIPPEDIIPTRRPKLKKQTKQPPSAAQKNLRAAAKPIERSSGENQTRRSGTWPERGGEVITCISEFLEPDPPVQNTRSPPGTSTRPGRAIGMDDAASIERLSSHVNGPSAAWRGNVDVTAARPKVVTRFEPPLEELVQSRKASRQSPEGRGSFSSDSSKPLGPHMSPRKHSSTREFQLPGRLSRNHSICGEGPIVVQRSHSNSCSASASSGHMRKNISLASSEKRELSDVEKLLQQITSQPWYPVRRKGSTGSAPAVVDTLVSMLKSTQTSVFHKVGDALLALEEAFLLTDDQRQLAVYHTLARLNSKAKSLSMKTAILKLLEGLGVGGKEVTLAILPLLTDSDLELRGAAFGALKGLSGIVNRAQLHQMLIQLGLLQNVVANEDEILRDLSSRVKAGQVKVPAMWYIQESSFRDKSKLLNEKESAALGMNMAPRCSHTSKHAVDMDNEALTHGIVEPEGLHCPDRHTASMDTTVEQLLPSDHPVAHTTTLPKVHPRVTERTTAPVADCAQPQSNKRARKYMYCHSNSLQPNCSGDSVKRSFLQYHSNSPQPNGPRSTSTTYFTVKANLRTSNKLQQLIAHNQTAFSQTKPVMGMMLDAYTHCKNQRATNRDDLSTCKPHKLIAHNLTAFSQTKPAIGMMLDAYTSNQRATGTDDYAWSEVFPMIKASRKLGTHQRSKSLQNKHLLPGLTSACMNGGADGAKLQVQDAHLMVKLPKISVSRVTYT